MADKYQNKYRIASARAPFWNYGWNAAYFITICTQDRTCYFGEIQRKGEDAINCLSGIGKIAHDCWMQIPNYFPFVTLGNHIVMPNHVHGIIIIDKPDDGRNGDIDDVHDAHDVETRLIASLPPHPPPSPNNKPPGGFAGDKNPMLHDNLSKIIRWYKGRSTFEMRKIHADFAWQPRFHDHIIRDNKAFRNISAYIVRNPEKWNVDRFYIS